MDIKEGDIITLQDGSKVKIKFEKIKGQVLKNIKLIPDKHYKLKHTGEFCHYMNGDDSYNLEKVFNYTFIYIGEIRVKNNAIRKIFFSKEECGYLMMSGKVNYVIEEL